MKKLYFIRHGLSEMNKSGHFAGTIDTPLAEEGRAQAKMAGIKARELRIDLIVTSPLIRASETAEIIARQIGYPKDKIVLSRLLIERHWGDLEGKPHVQVHDLDEVPNAETSAQLLERASKALAYLEGLEAENILVVSHGTFGRALRHHIIEDMPFINKVSDETIRLPNGEVICWI
jgi:uncharacterized phosphatase